MFSWPAAFHSAERSIKYDGQLKPDMSPDIFYNFKYNPNLTHMKAKQHDNEAQGPSDVLGNVPGLFKTTKMTGRSNVCLSDPNP